MIRDGELDKFWSIKGHIRQHRCQMCGWCYIFQRLLNLLDMELFFEVDTVSIGPVSHELYEKKNLETKSSLEIDYFR